MNEQIINKLTCLGDGSLTSQFLLKPLFCYLEIAGGWSTAALPLLMMLRSTQNNSLLPHGPGHAWGTREASKYHFSSKLVPWIWHWDFQTAEGTHLRAVLLGMFV